MGGAPLAAGGWYADGRSIGTLLRALCQTETLIPELVARQLWAPEWKNDVDARSEGWSYALGWYVRGNWVAWAGGADGSMATVLHNRAYDFTIVHLTNLVGNGLNDFAYPLMVTNAWDGSAIGQVFPCVDDFSTPQDECETTNPSVPY